MADRCRDRRPPEFSVSFTRLLSFPYRFCHPPNPSAVKVRSCSGDYSPTTTAVLQRLLTPTPPPVVPSFQVSLDDVLDRRHLPPLGLKDFEEWLLYVEQRPQYMC